MAGNLFFGMLLTLVYCYFNFLASLRTHLFEAGTCTLPVLLYIPVHSGVLLVVLEHPSTFLAAVIWTFSSCFTDFALPSHMAPAHSSFLVQSYSSEQII